MRMVLTIVSWAVAFDVVLWSKSFSGYVLAPAIALTLFLFTRFCKTRP